MDCWGLGYICLGSIFLVVFSAGYNTIAYLVILFWDFWIIGATLLLTRMSILGFLDYWGKAMLYRLSFLGYVLYWMQHCCLLGYLILGFLGTTLFLLRCFILRILDF